MKNILIFGLLFCFINEISRASEDFGSAIIAKVKIEGNKKVETEAIRNLLSSKPGDRFVQEKIKNDILVLHELGYFSDIRFFKEEKDLIVSVEEKPAVSSISFVGMNEVKEEDIRKALETTLYQIVNEGSLYSDVRLIEKRYTEKGYYLADVSYTLNPRGQNEVDLVFHVEERGKVLVGDVELVGNRYFSDEDIISKMASQPYTRWNASLGSSSIFQDAFIKRDVEFISYYYKDNGFSDVKVGNPILILDSDKKFVRVTIEIEEGVQYKVGELRIAGDLIDKVSYSEEELIDVMLTKSGEIFSFSKFSKDIEMLVDKYGDLGYAYADINPIPHFDKETKEVNIEFHVSKGQKVYFGEINIVGNTKTRDNVVRRELEVYDSELFSGTKLTSSKANIQRLGFFEEVQVFKERDPNQPNLLNLKIKVKEKPTGQLQAAFGYSPGKQTSSRWFGQGRYDEKNQSGQGWNTNLTAKYGGQKNWELDTGFFNPRVNDSQWSLGSNLTYKWQEVKYATGISGQENIKSISGKLGRELYHRVSGSLSLKHSRIEQEGERSDTYLLEDTRALGIKNSFSIGVSRRDLNNYLDPSQGTSLAINQKFVGGPLGGHYQFSETTLVGEWYVPFTITDFNTYFKFKGQLGQLWTLGGENISFSERYTLGYYDLRGFKYRSIGPKERRIFGPQGKAIDFNVGGDKQFFTQLEYFIPLIPQAGIKALIFADVGQVFSEGETISLSFKDYRKDVGFGIRWLTPIAPFRFEWAFPYDEETQTFGDQNFIFNIGF